MVPVGVPHFLSHNAFARSLATTRAYVGDMCITGLVRLVMVRPKWMISESIRRRGDQRGRGVVQGPPVSGGDDRALRMAVHRFPLSFREVEELMLVRGVIVSDETIRSGRNRPAGCGAAGNGPPTRGISARCS